MTSVTLHLFTRRLVRLLAAAVCVGAPLALSIPAPAHAGSLSCDTVVNDRAGVLDVKVVRAAARAAKGRVLVLTYADVPRRDLDAAVRKAQNACPAWDGPGDDWAGAMVVIAVSVGDRRAGAYHGPAHDRALAGGRRDKIVDSMTPSFKAGDWNGGILAGIDTADSLLSRRVRPPVLREETYDTVTTVQNTGSGTSISGKAVAWVLGVPAAVGGAFGGFFLVRSQRRRISVRKGARASARAAQDMAAALFMRLDDTAELVEATVNILPTGPDEAIAAVRAGAAQARMKSTDSTDAWLAHAEAHPSETLLRLGTEEAENVARAAGEVTARLNEAVAAWESVDAEVTALRARVDQLPVVATSVRETATAVRACTGDLSREGYRTQTYTEACGKAEALAVAAQASHSENLWGRACAQADEGLELAQGALTAVSGLRQRRSDLIAEHGRLAARADAVRDLLSAGERAAEAEAGVRHSECVQDLAGILAAGRASHAQAVVSLAAAAEASSMQVQDFDAAHDALETAMSLLDSAEEGAEAPKRRGVDLAELMTLLPVTIGAVMKEAEELEATMLRRGDALRFLADVPEPAAMITETEVATAELSAERPRLLTLDKTVQALAHTVNQGSAAVEAVVAHYDRAASELEAASHAVRDAEAAAARSGAGSAARAAAQAAQSLLSQAAQYLRDGNDLDEAERRIAEARRAGVEAEQKARRAIAAARAREEAEDRRRAEERRRAASASSFGAGFGGSGGGSDRGGSSGFGGGSDRGGSSGFGGGSDRGGSKGF